MIPQTTMDNQQPQLLSFDLKSGDDKVQQVPTVPPMRLISFTEGDEELDDDLFDENTPSEDDDDSSVSSINNGTSWYDRNTTAMEAPLEMRKHIIAESRMGTNMVTSLQEAATSSKKKNTTNDITGKRRERKSVLPKQTWSTVEEQLGLVGIDLVSRESKGTVSDEERIGATLTYYGTTASFYNHQVFTKIRMRIRYYLSYVRTEDGTITDVRREGATKDKGFLELKVKGPRANEENSVDKYRILVSDALISDLINLDATQPTFLNELELVKQGIQRETNNGQLTNLIDTMFQTIGKLAKRKPAFIRPSLVITYERSAFKYIEHDYPIPVAGVAATQKRRAAAGSLRKFVKGKKTSKRARRAPWSFRRSHQTRPLREGTDPTESSSTETPALINKNQGAQQQQHRGDDDSTAAESVQNVEHHDIEYQFTVDRNVRAHYPLLPARGTAWMPVAEHFNMDNRTELMRYPADARVVEFKEPLAVATLPEKDRSADHNSLIRILVDRMEREIMWGEYDENVGKYGNFRRRLIEEHATNRLKNESIQIDFSGTGLYISSNLERRREERSNDDET